MAEKQNLTIMLQRLRDELMPHSKSNVDPILFDYKYWTDVSKIAAKKREEALEKCLVHAPKELKPGIIVRGARFLMDFTRSNPMNKFDLEKFLELLLKKWPKERVFLREQVVAATGPVAGSERKTFTVKEDVDNG